MKKNKILAIMMATVIAGSLYTNSAFAGSVQLTVGSTSTSSNMINMNFNITNEGTAEINLSDLKIRYYFTRDNDSSLNFYCYHSAIAYPYKTLTSNVTGKFVKMNMVMEGADTYTEISFSDGSGILGAGECLGIQGSIARSDWSNFDQSNDYSFNNANKVVVLINDTIVSGIQPIMTFKVTYNANGGNGDVPVDPKDYDENKNVSVMSNTLTRDGYTFASWNTAKDGKGANVAPGSTFNIGNSNITLYANWIPIPIQVAEIGDINVAKGKDKSDLGLPENIEVKLGDMNTTTAAVHWDEGTPLYNKEIEDTYIFTGILNLPNGISNPSNLKAKAKVIVKSSSQPPVNPPVVPGTKDETTTPAAVTIKGTERVGKTLEAVLLTEGGAKFTTSAGVTYDWYRLSSENDANGTLVGDEATYKLVSADKGKYIKVVAGYDGDIFEKVTGRIARKSSSGSSSSSGNSNSTDTSDATKGAKQSGNSAISVQTSNGWQKQNDGTWKYTENGQAAVGWKKINGIWYSFAQNGTMETGFKQEGGKTYYLDNNGAMSTGWQLVDGKWYYLNLTGAMATGWINLEGKWYYLYGDGSMAKSTIINGYYVDENGAWV